MTKSENKTNPTAQSVADFIASVENETRRADAKTLLNIMCEITGEKPTMWGPSLIGFGRYHYKYDSGREGDIFMTGFSPRKANLVIYIMPGYSDHSAILARLGKHKLGKSCLYLNKLADVDEAVLRELIAAGYAETKNKYHA